MGGWEGGRWEPGLGGLLPDSVASVYIPSPHHFSRSLKERIRLDVLSQD